MKQGPLAALAVLLTGALVLRFTTLKDGSPQAAVALVRTQLVAVASKQGGALSDHVTLRQDDLSGGTREPDPSDPRNAFALRVPQVPQPAVVSHPQAIAAPNATPVGVPPISPPTAAPAAPAPPPFQVIGTWQDDGEFSAFLAGARGVLQARPGDVMLSEYRVVTVTPQQVLLQQMPAGREIALTVPVAASGSPSTVLSK